jgi:hypothetical protein
MGFGPINVILNATTSIERQTRQKAINTLKRQQDTKDRTTPKEYQGKMT